MNKARPGGLGWASENHGRHNTDIDAADSLSLCDFYFLKCQPIFPQIWELADIEKVDGKSIQSL